jgi:hypothetical protein
MDDKIKGDEMGSSCSKHGGVEKCICNLVGRDRFEDLGAGWRIVLKWILRKYGGRIFAGFILFRVDTSGRLL